MKDHRKLLLAVLLALALIAPRGQIAMAENSIIYVHAGATGANNGTSWADAYTTLQPALEVAAEGDQIWVAAGTYTPTDEFTPGDPRSATFQMKNGVAVYGGFSGTESLLAERDWVNNVTILSGDIGIAGDTSDNSYHVFYHSQNGLTSNAILDGVTITGGNATFEYPHDRGGGMYNDASSPALYNCIFAANAAIYGGGMYNINYASPYVTGCTFSGNTASYGGGLSNQYYASPHLSGVLIYANTASIYGGGIHNQEYARLDMYNSTIEQNTAGIDGGGMYNNSSSPAILNGDFLNNTALLHGGALFNTNGSSPVLTNCIIAGNEASNSAGHGGGIYNDASSPLLTNCTVYGNRAPDGGGGIFNTSASTPVVINTILWRDTPDEILNDASVPVVTFSDIQGGYSGEGNISEDPLFRDENSFDFHIFWDSPCIDIGNNAAPQLFWGDFEGDERPMDGDGDGTVVVDIGADEIRYYPLVEVEIDIKPTSSSNVINLDSKSTLAVAILTTLEFDAYTVNPATVEFAGAEVVRSLMQDVDQDGDLDLLLYFKIQDLDLDESSTEATLLGVTYNWTPVQGTDRVKIR